MGQSNSPKPQNLGRTYRPWIDEKFTPTEFGHVSMFNAARRLALAEFENP